MERERHLVQVDMTDRLGEELLRLNAHAHDERNFAAPVDDPLARAAIRLARAYAAQRGPAQGQGQE